MRYLLDANNIIRSFVASEEALRVRLVSCEEGDLATSVIAYAEVALGARPRRLPGTEALAALRKEVPVLPFDLAAAQAYARLPFRRASHDRLIAAQALAAGLVLVMDDVADFADVPGLAVENRTLPA